MVCVMPDGRLAEVTEKLTFAAPFAMFIMKNVHSSKILRNWASTVPVKKVYVDGVLTHKMTIAESIARGIGKSVRKRKSKSMIVRHRA